MSPGWAGACRLSLVADNRQDFADFAPYVPATSDRGTIAFQATMRGGDSRVFIHDGRAVQPLHISGDSSPGPVASHPDLTDAGDCSFYASEGTGSAAWLVRGDRAQRLALGAGPAGPTMNAQAAVAFRADGSAACPGDGRGGSGLYLAQGGLVRRVAHTSDGFVAFYGLPVVNAAGAVVFRADRSDRSSGIFVWQDGRTRPVADSGDRFSTFGYFPTMNDAGTIVFVASLRDGGSAVFLDHDGVVSEVFRSGDAFETIRGALLDGVGRIVCFATPRGRSLSVLSGPDPDRDVLLALGTPISPRLLDEAAGAALGIGPGGGDAAALDDLALNPVSINEAGQFTVRVRLRDGRQAILRAVRVGASGPT